MGLGCGMMYTARMASTARSEPGELILGQVFRRTKEARQGGIGVCIQERANSEVLVAEPGETHESAGIGAPALDLGLEIRMALVDGEVGRRGALDLGFIWEQKRGVLGERQDREFGVFRGFLGLFFCGTLCRLGFWF